MDKSFAATLGIFLLISTTAFAFPPFDDGGGCSTVQYKWAHAPTVDLDVSKFASKPSYTVHVPQLRYSIENGGNYDLGVSNLKIDLSQAGGKIDYRIYGGITYNEDAHSAWSGPSKIILYPKDLGPGKAIDFAVQFAGKGGNGSPAPWQPVSGSAVGDLSKIKSFVISNGSPHDTLALDDDSYKRCRATGKCDARGCRGPGAKVTIPPIPVWTFP